MMHLSHFDQFLTYPSFLLTPQISEYQTYKLLHQFSELVRLYD